MAGLGARNHRYIQSDQRARPRSLSPLTGAVAVDPYIRGRTKSWEHGPALRPRGQGEASAVPGHGSAAKHGPAGTTRRLGVWFQRAGGTGSWLAAPVHRAIGRRQCLRPVLFLERQPRRPEVTFSVIEAGSATERRAGRCTWTCQSQMPGVRLFAKRMRPMRLEHVVFRIILDLIKLSGS